MLFRYGKFTVENLIHLVLDSPGDLQPTLWYICEFHSWKNSEDWPITRLKSSSPSSSERDNAIAKKDLTLLQERQDQQLIIQREKTIAQKEKNLAQKENLLQQKLLRAELREREALEFEQEAKIKLEEVDEKEQELEAEKEKLALKKNKNKKRFSTTSTNIPTHDTENTDDDETPTNENNDDNNQWLLRFSNLQQRLESAYREIENLRRPVFPAATTTKITTTAANGDNDNIINNDNDDNGDDNKEDNENEKSSSSIITSLQHELKVTKENAQKLKEENILLRKTMNQSKNFAFSEQNVSSERNVSFLKRRGIRDNLVDDVDEASSVGNRWAPLNFRMERMRESGRREGEEEGIVGMIEMQKEFTFLERLR